MNWNTPDLLMVFELSRSFPEMGNDLDLRRFDLMVLEPLMESGTLTLFQKRNGQIAERVLAGDALVGAAILRAFGGGATLKTVQPIDAAPVFAPLLSYINQQSDLAAIREIFQDVGCRPPDEEAPRD